MFCTCCRDDEHLSEIESLPRLDGQPFDQKPPDLQETKEASESPEPTQPAEDEFLVKLEKTAAQSTTGVVVEKLWGRILITKVSGGLINDYNKRAAVEGLPKVEVGHIIAGVNGVNGSPQQILKTLEADPRFTLTIRVPKQQN
mmetsp:Transcript_35867/g.78527  ORF Transcript_35867/g.78527 Transcript_35867/m.78527 type:complete len:143 (-) Transcript_35867:271-699(-)